MSSFDKDFFFKNRERLARQVPGQLIVIPAHSLLQSSADMAFPFRQDSNFWYLTGIDEPNLVLLIDTDKNESALLLPEQNDYQKQWEGENDNSEFKQASGIAAYGSVKSLKRRLKVAKDRGLKIGYLKPLDEVVQPFGFYSNPARRRIEKIIKQVEQQPVDIRIEIARLRQIKQPVELEVIQRAIDITAETLAGVKSSIKSLKNEKDIEQAISAGFYARGANGHAYEPIVASGGNAALLHYQKNNQDLKKDNLLLLDVGAQFQGYAADITRMWAIGNPTKRQKEVLEAVKELQEDFLKQLKPGVTLRDFYKLITKKTIAKLKQLKVKNPEKMPQGYSHFLGLDVHDAGDPNAPLQEGMVLTVEPGIYLADEGIGVRIEDDVLITKKGVKILSENISKEL